MKRVRLLTLIACLLYILRFRSNRLLIVNLRPSSCGMGNQMFRYAAALGLTEKNPAFTVCWSSWNWFRPTEHHNSSFLQHTQPITSLPECPHWDSVMGELLLPHFAPPPWKYVPFTPETATVVNGAMETFRYFPTTSPVFRLKSALDATRWMRERNLTSAIHVRRGDYTWTAAPIGFYQRAQVRRAVIVTDDPAWVLQHPLVFGHHVLSQGHDPGFDMALLAAATDTVVIGIGTFAWWGAYLSSARHIIYYSRQAGYADYEYVEQDHMPEQWVKQD